MIITTSLSYSFDRLTNHTFNIIGGKKLLVRVRVRLGLGEVDDVIIFIVKKDKSI